MPLSEEAWWGDTERCPSNKAWVIFKSLLVYSLVVFLLISGGLYVYIDNIRITPARVLSIVMLGLLIRNVLSRGRFVYGGAPGLFLMAWLSLSLGIDVAHDSRYSSLQHFASLLSSVSWFYVVVNIKPRWRLLQHAVIRVGMWLGFASVVALAMRQLSFDPWGMTDWLAPQVGNYFRLKMFSWEPNILGAAAALGLTITLSLFGLSPKRYVLAMAVMGVVFIGAFSKGPWLAFVAGLLFFIMVSKSRLILRYFVAVSLLVCIVFVVSLTVSPSSLSKDILRTHNIDVRWVIIQHAIKGIADSPLWGNSTFSFGQMWPYLELQFGNNEIGQAWIPQTFVGVLHDTGLLGLGLYSAFLAVLLVMGFRVCRRARLNGAGDFAYFSAAVLAAQVVLMVQGIATTLYDQPVYWAVMGMVAMLPVWSRELGLPSLSDDRRKLLGVKV